jgi:hypothetical protein
MHMHAHLVSAFLLLVPSLAAQSKAADPIEEVGSMPLDRQRAAAAALLAELGKLDAHKVILDAFRGASASCGIGANRPAAPDSKNPEKSSAAKPSARVSRPKPTVKKSPSPVDEAVLDRSALPSRVEYCFGQRTILLSDLANHADAKQAKAAGGKASAGDHSPQKPAPEDTDPILLRHAMLGCVPDADKALASLLFQLDADEGGAEFSLFLQGWRNEKESFYEALDRTAGTKDSLFYYDAMLHDFTDRFAKGSKGKALKQSLGTAQDALHDSFLALRQYRGFREAVAWTLVIPPSSPLPHRLQRYEAKAEGAYSLREQVLMVAECLDYDLHEIVALVLADAPRLSEPIWSKAYDPYPAWNASFMKLQPTMIQMARSTDGMLDRAKTRRAELADALRKIATTVIADQHTARAKAH